MFTYSVYKYNLSLTDEQTIFFIRADDVKTEAPDPIDVSGIILFSTEDRKRAHSNPVILILLHAAYNFDFVGSPNTSACRRILILISIHIFGRMIKLLCLEVAEPIAMIATLAQVSKARLQLKKILGNTRPLLMLHLCTNQACFHSLYNSMSKDHDSSTVCRTEYDCTDSVKGGPEGNVKTEARDPIDVCTSAGSLLCQSTEEILCTQPRQ